MEGREIASFQLSTDEAEGIADETKRLAERKRYDIACDYPNPRDIRNVLLHILG